MGTRCGCAPRPAAANAALCTARSYRRPDRCRLAELGCLVDDERLLDAGAVGVKPARAAIARRGARYRVDLGIPALVEGGGAGDLDGGAPGAVYLADHERLDVAGAVGVTAARATVARPGARQ